MVDLRMSCCCYRSLSLPPTVVPWVGLKHVIAAFPGHTHLLVDTEVKVCKAVILSTPLYVRPGQYTNVMPRDITSSTEVAWENFFKLGGKKRFQIQRP